MNSWFRRRAPRLSGILHIRDAGGHELMVPLRGRDILLTAPGNGLSGYGEAWAISSPAPGLMIVYGLTESVDDRRSGICPPQSTITFDGVDFTWLTGAAVRIPSPRSPARNESPGRRTPPRTLRNMARFVTRTRVKG